MKTWADLTADEQWQLFENLLERIREDRIQRVIAGEHPGVCAGRRDDGNG